MREEAHKVQVQCEVNGQAVTLEAHPMARLLDVLRENLRLTGTKEGCGEGECGACSIEVNGELVNSCLVPVLHVDGASMATCTPSSGHFSPAAARSAASAHPAWSSPP
jgi:carbon-monoxide dehydrogenase small subunit